MIYPWKLAVASGKGGTGKTTVSLSLSRCLPADVIIADCDVEEPNQHLFLQNSKTLSETPFYIPMPRFREDLCEGCGVCAQVCEFGALAMAGKTPVFFNEMCHSCGACVELCPNHAFVEQQVQVGSVIQRRSLNHTYIEGNLIPGYSHAPRLIHGVKKAVPLDSPVLLDCPPGASCATHAALEGADYALLVTEPTPFGLHDLQSVMAMVRDMEIPFGIVINRDGLGGSVVDDYCAQNNIPVLARIPFREDAAETGALGNVLYDAIPELRAVFEALKERILEKLGSSSLVSTTAGKPNA